jgi:hypothetical protein
VSMLHTRIAYPDKRPDISASRFGRNGHAESVQEAGAPETSIDDNPPVTGV